MRRLLVACALTLPASFVPRPGLSQQRPITFEDFIALKAVSDPQLSPNGKWVAYTVTTPSLQDNRGVSRIWLAELATGRTRELPAPRQGSDRQPRWSPDGKTLAFISTRQEGPQVWVVPLAGGDARDVVARLPYVDSTQMGAAGASYGGYMIAWIAGHTDRFKVLVDHDGVFNTVCMAGSTEELWFTDWEFGGTLYRNGPLYDRWSPPNFVQQWKTPILFVHGQLDYRVDLSEGYQAFTAARRMGVDAKFLYFPDEGHWVLKPRNRRLWWGTVLDWLEEHLK
ncbi:MAG: prolyl oligopeptidase family serine peptidase [Gemmatimonadales bacterium]